MLDLETEEKYFSLNYNIIAGVDEAGRGPLAGPVVAACVVIDNHFKIDEEELGLVKDSKKLNAKQREKLFSIIKEKALAVEIGIVDNRKIDVINILQASFLAMKKAINKVKVKPEYVLVDGKFIIPNLKMNQSAIIKGDEKVFVIAAASIIAKVSRDYLMNQYDKKYPQYLFAKHKGYGTKLHIEAIKKYGPSPIHRLSFNPLRSLLKKKRA